MIGDEAEQERQRLVEAMQRADEALTATPEAAAKRAADAAFADAMQATQRADAALAATRQAAAKRAADAAFAAFFMSHPAVPADPEAQMALDREFTTLYRRHLRRIHAYVSEVTGSKRLAEDITAATFERAHTEFRRRGHPDDEAWLLGIVDMLIRQRRGR